MISKITKDTKLICPDSEIKDYMVAIECESFWIDRQNVWNVECYVCGGSHNVGDMIHVPETDFGNINKQKGNIMKGIEALREQVKIQCSDGNWNYDRYMHGMANGLICALATIEDKNPEYLDAPKLWLCDIKVDGELEPEQNSSQGE